MRHRAENAAPRESRPTVRRRRAAVAGVLALAAVLRVAPLGLGEPRFFHLDEWDFALSAQQMVIEGDLNPHRFLHPGLYRYAIALVYPVASVAVEPLMEPEARAWLPYVAGRMVSAALGVVGVWLVLRLGLRLLGLPGAAFAGLVLATMPLHVKFSHIAKPDVTMAMWVALATLLAWRLAEAPSRRLYVLAGLCAGFAASTRYNGAVACVPVLAGHLAARGPRGLVRRLAAPDLWLAGAASALAFLATSPYALIDFATMREQFAAGYAFVVAGSGAEAARRPWALAAFGREAAVWIGLAPLGLAAAGGWLWWRANRRALLVVGSAVAAYALLISGWAFPQAYYLMPVVPAVAVLAAVPVARLWAGRRRLALALAAACLAPATVLSVREVVRLWRPDTREEAARWLSAQPDRPPGWILRDYDALWDTASDALPVRNPGADFYEAVGRGYLKGQHIACFVLSDDVAARHPAAHEALVACGDLVARFPPGWWREGPGIGVYRVKETLLRAFEAERAAERHALQQAIAAVDGRLEARPRDAALHMEAGRLLCRLATACQAHQAVGFWAQAAGRFTKAAALEPALADAHYDLGCVDLRVSVWLWSQRRAEEAIAVADRAASAFRRAIELDPARADYHFNLGFALYTSAVGEGPHVEAHRAESQAAYRRAAELDPAIGPPALDPLAVSERGFQPLH